MSKRADRYIAILNKADEVYQKDYSIGEYCHEQSFKWGFQEGCELTEKDLGWHPSTEHPPVDEEVIVLLGNYDDFPQIAIGHTVDTEAVVDIYGNPYKIIEYNGWNIPGVKWWMPMPKIPNEDE